MAQTLAIAQIRWHRTTVISAIKREFLSLLVTARFLAYGRSFSLSLPAASHPPPSP